MWVALTQYAVFPCASCSDVVSALINWSWRILRSRDNWWVWVSCACPLFLSPLLPSASCPIDLVIPLHRDRSGFTIQKKLWSYSQPFTFDIEKATLQTMSCKFEDCRCWWAKLCIAHSCQGAPKKIPKIHSYCTRAVLFERETQTLLRSTSQMVPQHHCGMESHSHKLFLSKHRLPRFLLFLFFTQLEYATLHHYSIALPFVWLALCTNPRPIHSNSFSRLNPAFGDHHSMFFKVVCSVRSGTRSWALHLVGRCGICFSFPWRPLLGLTFPSKAKVIIVVYFKLI